MLNRKVIKEKRLKSAVARVLKISKDNRAYNQALSLAERVENGDLAALYAVERRASPWNKISEENGAIVLDFFEAFGQTDPGMGQKGTAYRISHHPAARWH